MRKLTMEQAREVRLSMESHAVVAERFGLAVKSIHQIRAGINYGALARDERAAQTKRCESYDLRPPHPTDALLVTQPRYSDLACQMSALSFQEAQDAAWECSHGRLPGDPTPPCGCWPQERPVLIVIDGPPQLELTYPKEVAA